jgi:hypothetical protein
MILLQVSIWVRVMTRDVWIVILLVIDHAIVTEDVTMDVTDLGLDPDLGRAIVVVIVVCHLVVRMIARQDVIQIVVLRIVAITITRVKMHVYYQAI